MDARSERSNQAAALLRTWMGFNWARVVFTSAAWLMALRALSLPG